MTEYFVEIFQHEVNDALRSLTKRGTRVGYPLRPSELVDTLEKMMRIKQLSEEEQQALRQLRAKVLKSDRDNLSELREEVYRWQGLLGEELKRQEERRWRREQEQLLGKLLALEPEPQKWHRTQEQQEKEQPVSRESLAELQEQYDKVRKQKAKEYATRSDIRAILCPALQSASGDVFEIAKIITPILVGLSMAGTVAIPLVPMLFASIALVISRMGIAGLCAEYGKRDSSARELKNIFDGYGQALFRLYSLLPRKRSEVWAYQQRLSENIDQTLRYGDTETRRSDRAMIIDELNKIAFAELGVEFIDLCL